MRRQTTAFVTALLLVVAAAAVPIPGLAQSDGTATATATPTSDESPENETDDVAPGELLQGVIGVQEAELEGEIRTRAFGIRVARAASDEARAEVLAEELNESTERLAELKERRERLRERLETGNISRGEYRAEMARLAAETETIRTLANASANVSTGLPAETLERRGINVTAIRTLSERANELTGPEVSRIARSIAGPRVGVGRGPPVNVSERRGPPGNATERGGPAENATERGGPPENASEQRGPPNNGTARGPPEGRDNDGDAREGTETPEGGEQETPESGEQETPESDEQETPESDEQETPESDEQETPEGDDQEGTDGNENTEAA